MISETNILIFSLLGGIVPAFFWLWFWIREDRLRPEPKSALLTSFISGILAVLFALFFELVIYYIVANANISINNREPTFFWHPLEQFVHFFNISDWQDQFWTKAQAFFDSSKTLMNYRIDAKKFFLVVLLAPVIEELLKFLFTYSVCLRRKINDEPIDASIYMLTTALGFAAVETAIFLTEPLAKGHIVDTIIAQNFRSIGPMLIHLVSSAMLGLFIGFAFYKPRLKKVLYFFLGLVVAISLHATFNLFIMLNETTSNLAFFWTACLGTWILVIILLVFFEQVKKVVRFPTKLARKK